jgi:hypothetical protein
MARRRMPYIRGCIADACVFGIAQASMWHHGTARLSLHACIRLPHLIRCCVVLNKHDTLLLVARRRSARRCSTHQRSLFRMRNGVIASNRIAITIHHTVNHIQLFNAIMFSELAIYIVDGH